MKNYYSFQFSLMILAIIIFAQAQHKKSRLIWMVVFFNFFFSFHRNVCLFMKNNVSCPYRWTDYCCNIIDISLTLSHKRDVWLAIEQGLFYNLFSKSVLYQVRKILIITLWLVYENRKLNMEYCSTIIL